MNFNYHLPVNIIFGRGKINKLGTEVAKQGSKVLIVTGKSSTKKTGLLDRVIDLLKNESLEYEVFDQVEQNPLTTTVYAGADVARKTKCNVILGLGGGSVMDAAKSIAFSSLNSGDISEYIFGIKTGDKALPIVLVPTTSGTGSEGNCFSVLTNPKTLDKKSLKANCIYAKASIVDPELMMTMPKNIIASVGFDALAHNIEAYIANRSNPFTEMQALEGIKLIGENLEKVYNNPTDLEAWDKIALASTLGGMVIGASGVGLPHGMEHPASGLRNVVHGRGLAALTPIIISKSWQSNIDKFSKISVLLGGTDASDCTDALNNLLEKVDLKVTLGDLGVLEEDVEWMTENCMKISEPNIKNHPQPFTKEDIKEIYLESL